MNNIENNKNDWNSNEYWEREKVRIPLLQDTIDVVMKNLKKVKEDNMEHFIRIYNVSLFILIVERDMAVLIQHYIKEFTLKWERIYFARQIVLLLHETLDDIPHMLGKEFRESIKKFPLWDEAENELKQISKRISRYKKSNEATLEDIRNIAIAHREQDALKQIEMIENIRSDNIKRLLVDFYEAFNPLVPFLTHVTEIMGKPRIILHHLSEGIEKKER